MLSNGKKYLVVFAFSLITLPVWAAHTDSLSWNPVQSMTIGTTQVMPGNYQLRAEEGQSNLEVIHDGKVVATVPCSWMQLPSKAEYSEVQSNANQVTQVQFSGRTEAIQFNR
jgi:hypothetical protein